MEKKIITKKEGVKVNKLLKETGETYATIKYWSDNGLLPFFKRDGNKLAKRYDLEATKERIREIRELKAKYLPIPVIKKHFKELNKRG